MGARRALDHPGPALARSASQGCPGRAGSVAVRARGRQGGHSSPRIGCGASGAAALRAWRRPIPALGGARAPPGAVSAPDAQIASAVEQGGSGLCPEPGEGRSPEHWRRAGMDRLKDRAIQVARRVGKGAAALALHYSGARELLSTVQRRAVGGRRILILSYHRVVGDYAQEAKRSLYTLNIEQKTFRCHLEVLQESHDVVSLDEALSVLEGTRQAARDVAVVTFDDGYRDVYTHAYPVMRDLRIPGVVYVPSGFIGTDRRLGHDRLFTALRKMVGRGIGPMAVGVGHPGERWLIDALEGNATPEIALERLIARHPTPGLLRL